MNEWDTWDEVNKAYLDAALHWLHLRLQRHIEAHAARMPVHRRRGLSGIFRQRSGQAAVGGVTGVSTEDLEKAAAAMVDAEQIDPPPALIRLSERFGLSRFAREVLLLCAAMELDPRIAPLCAHAQNDPHRPFPTFSLAMALFDDAAWDAVAAGGALRYWHLIEINQPGAEPLTTSALRADERVVNALLGWNNLDARLTPLLAPIGNGADGALLSPSQESAVTRARRQVEQALSTGQPPLVQLLGPDNMSKQLVAQHAAADLGLPLYRLPADVLPPQTAELETLSRLWQREWVLSPVALYLDAQESDGPALSEGHAPPLGRFLARRQGVVFLGTREVRPELGPTTSAVEVEKPTPAEQQAAWSVSLGTHADNGSPELLGGQFDLNLPTISQIVNGVAAEPSSNGRIPHERLWAACLSVTRPHLDLLAQRLAPIATWDDIVLPDNELQLLRQIADQVRQRGTVYDQWGFRGQMNRGLGISALFAGESGTGKTMAAEVIANDLRLNLYRIDLSAVINKYIGETEKNLRRVFDAAEKGGAILLFDEADALFGKRSQVKDSHDRYANIEVNYLLQRIEAFHGLAILATNMKSALDHAFMRRVRFQVHFPFPDRTERERIWVRVFPPATPTAGLDFSWLARLNLTGAGIHNSALHAAFLAAQAGTPVTMPLVLAAARTELRKLERPVNEADFRWTETVAAPVGPD